MGFVAALEKGNLHETKLNWRRAHFGQNKGVYQKKIDTLLD
jgi:hypothetical protein